MWEDARHDFQKLSDFPDRKSRAMGFIGLANLEMETNPIQARTFLERSIWEYETIEAGNLLSEINYGYLETTGRTFLKSGEFAKANYSFEELSHSPFRKWQASGWLGRAAISKATGSWSFSNLYSRKAFAAEPSQAALYGISQSEYKLGRMDTAKYWAMKLIQKDPEKSKSIVLLMDILAGNNDRNGAVKLGHNAILKNPNSCELKLAFQKLILASTKIILAEGANPMVTEVCPEPK